ncbi:MAG: A/G-specific adenine glycosylase [Candidatus Eremiobacteraeota bacterium]|nr:A/G-specific adenine glycosylase [Candidatus Eremiobacteraeota bacterium]
MNASQDALLAWYARDGRCRLPWRIVRDPYYTVVSEFMLHQTQVDRVIPKFEEFVARYSNVSALARAKTSDVVRLWEGLGYNSRAIRLIELARDVVERFDGNIPRETATLRSLPGVGAYTAAAIRAFGYNEDDAAVDTNVRRIVHRTAFGIEYPPKANATEIDEAARREIPSGWGHDWNSAMMDLGARVCTARAPLCALCPLQTSCAAAPVDPIRLAALRKQYAKAPAPQNAVPFVRTTRYARGRIVDRLRRLAHGQRISLLDLHRELQPLLANRTLDDLGSIVLALERDGLLTRSGEAVSLKD